MTVLEVSPDAPLWAKYGADALLVLHIGGGAVGIATGWVAVTSRKGETIHRAAGRIFFIAMLICYVVATGVAPFLSDGQRVNTIAGLLALYMLLSAWRTVRRRETAPEWPEKAGLIMALMIIAMNFVFIQLGASSSTGMIDGASYEPLYLFSIIAFFAAAGEMNLILRGGLSADGRIARHLWRMCVSFFIASGSFFLGQQQVMPGWMRGSPVLIALALAPLIFMVFYLVKVRLWPKRRSPLRA